MRVRCRQCHYIFVGRVPKGGDGSALVPVWHKRWVSGRSEAQRGSNQPCPGRFEEGEWLDHLSEAAAT